MQTSSKETQTTKSTARHESGALAAWGLIIGGVLGLAIGELFGRALIGGFVLATLAATTCAHVP